MVHNARTLHGRWRTVEQSGARELSESSLVSSGAATSVHLRVPRAAPSTSFKPSVLRAGTACVKLFVVLGIVGWLQVGEVRPDPGPLRLPFREGKPAVRGGVVPRKQVVL
jgi:hypothetical protein